MDWIKLSEHNLPPQGLKILCFKNGDLWVAYRFELKGKQYWVEFSYGGGGTILTQAPEYWVKLDLPNGFNGYMLTRLEEGAVLITFDEWQRQDLESYEKFIGVIIKNSNKPGNRKNLDGMD